MKKISLLTIIFSTFILGGCDLDSKDDDYIKGTWHMDCYQDDNVVSGVRGEYRFEDGVLNATMLSCYPSGNENTYYVKTVSFNYEFGDSVILGSGIEAQEFIIHTDGGDILSLVYKDEDRNEIYWNWGFSNTSLEYSIFGFYVLNDNPEWGGYPVYKGVDDFYYPIKDNITNQKFPTTISLNGYLKKGSLEY